jgi:hypothetical protein
MPQDGRNVCHSQQQSSRTSPVLNQQAAFQHHKFLQLQRLAFAGFVHAASSFPRCRAQTSRGTRPPCQPAQVKQHIKQGVFCAASQITYCQNFTILMLPRPHLAHVVPPKHVGVRVHLARQALSGARQQGGLTQHQRTHSITLQAQQLQQHNSITG